MFNALFVRRGERIQSTHRHGLIEYGILMFLPFLALLGYMIYSAYPILMEFRENEEIFKFNGYLILGIIYLILSVLITLNVINKSLLQDGYFAKVRKKAWLAKYLIDNDYVVRKAGVDGKEKTSLPPVYYKFNKDIDEITFEIGNKFHDRFLNIGKPIEEFYMADLVEIERVPRFVTYKFLVDNISKRLEFEQIQIKNGAIEFMKGVFWDLDELPHMLITGGTGGGKTYFIYTLIAVLGCEGRVHIADPKKADLSALENFKAFIGLIAYDKNDILNRLKEAVELMDKRYKYMKEHENNAMGKNYRYYGMKPEIFIVDEWGAFVSTLTPREEMDLYQQISPLVLKARQAGVFLIVATQKAGTDVIKSSIRDNLMCKVSLGTLSATGYEMTFGSESKNKAFVNKPKIKGRGYIDVGSGIAQEFYAPLVSGGFSFEEFFEKMSEMPYTDVSHIVLSNDEKEDMKQDFWANQDIYIEENKSKQRAKKQERYKIQEEKHKKMIEQSKGPT